MFQIELRPSLEECIETLAKREYEKGLRSCLDSEKDGDELMEKVELLRFFLQSADLRRLRAESERWLSRGKGVKFVLSLESGKLKTELAVL